MSESSPSNSTSNDGPLSWPDDPSDAKSASTKKPVQVKVAVVLTALGAGVGALLTFAFVQFYRWYAGMPDDERRKQIIDGLTKQSKDKKPPSAKEVNERIEAISTNLILLLVIFAVSVLLWIVMAYLVHRGTTWARIVATVLAPLNLLFVMTSPAVFSVPIPAFASIILGVAAAALLWTGKARSWAEAVKDARPKPKQA